MDSRIEFLFSDPIASDDGDLTDSRDYGTYVRQMDEIAAIKWNDVAPFVQAGRIGDIGCSTGSWLKYASEEPRLVESDLYGIEITRQLFEICSQRKKNGEFQNPNIWFAQKNAVRGLVFKRESMNTIHSSSLTHEIESYGSHEDLLRFIVNRYEELLPGGLWINRDVVGPENRDEIVHMKLNSHDGSIELADDLSKLSTLSRFYRFSEDFRKEEGYQISYETIESNKGLYIQLRMEDATEFLLTKDYTDNWNSEMHERFCFWSFSEWKEALENAGFTIDPGSRSFANPWIVQNRFAGKAELFNEKGEPTAFPPTNTILLARKN